MSDVNPFFSQRLFDLHLISLITDPLHFFRVMRLNRLFSRAQGIPANSAPPYFVVEFLIPLFLVNFPPRYMIRLAGQLPESPVISALFILACPTAFGYCLTGWP